MKRQDFLENREVRETGYSVEKGDILTTIFMKDRVAVTVDESLRGGCFVMDASGLTGSARLNLIPQFKDEYGMEGRLYIDKKRMQSEWKKVIAKESKLTVGDKMTKKNKRSEVIHLIAYNQYFGTWEVTVKDALNAWGKNTDKKVFLTEKEIVDQYDNVAEGRFLGILNEKI